GSGVEIQQKIRSAAPHFLSLNVDMIFNFPSQTPEILREDLRMVIESGAQQTTFYPLMSSPSVEKSIERSVGKLDTSREGEYYQIINDTLNGHFTPMSAWTFLRQGGGMIDEYIVDSEEYVGIGSGAFSYMDGTLYVNTFSLNQYQKVIASQRMSVNAVQPYGKHEQMRYRMMMDLFGLNFDRDVFKRRFGVPPALGLWLEMLFLNLAGAFGGTKRQKITPTGRYLSVVMMREFFTGVNNIRDIARQSLTPEERVCAMPAQKPSLNPQSSKATLR
ncbi:MAG: coproporphyrinogen dehydrogenase, partial [Anaerolineaceae bacterium]